MQAAHPSQPLRLADHVRACLSDGQVILLDLRRDKYFGVGEPHACSLAHCVAGWPTHPEDRPGSATSTTFGDLTRRLVAQGLLTDAAPTDKTVITIEPATASLDPLLSRADASISALRLGRFMRSAVTSALWMRSRSLDGIAAAVARRRSVLPTSPTDPGSIDALGEPTAAFERLRPFVFTAQDECLRDSLTLIGFLAAEGLFPRWVIGIKTRPFGAHSWVQHGETVLNDLHENVRRFHPILVV